MERELLLLGLLRGHEMHGYQLMEFIDTQMTSCVDLKKPTAYFLLEKMAGKGWIQFEQTQEGNRPLRRVYRITPDGEAAFQRLLRKNLGTYEQARFTSDIGLAFVDMLPAAEALELLRQRQVAIKEQLEAAREIPSHQGGAEYIIEHLRHHLAAELDWINSVIERIAVKSQHKKVMTDRKQKS